MKDINDEITNISTTLANAAQFEAVSDPISSIELNEKSREIGFITSSVSKFVQQSATSMSTINVGGVVLTTTLRPQVLGSHETTISQVFGGIGKGLGLPTSPYQTEPYVSGTPSFSALSKLF